MSYTRLQKYLESDVSHSNDKTHYSSHKNHNQAHKHSIYSKTKAVCAQSLLLLDSSLSLTSGPESHCPIYGIFLFILLVFLVLVCVLQI